MKPIKKKVLNQVGKENILRHSSNVFVYLHDYLFIYSWYCMVIFFLSINTRIKKKYIFLNFASFFIQIFFFFFFVF